MWCPALMGNMMMVVVSCILGNFSQQHPLHPLRFCQVTCLSSWQHFVCAAVAAVDHYTCAAVLAAIDMSCIQNSSGCIQQ
jgi:hypothetical protein